MSLRLKTFFHRFVINTVAVLVATHVVRGIYYDDLTGLLVATLMLGILNTFLRPVLLLLSLPLVIFTLGLFTLFVNALLLYTVGWLAYPHFHVVSFWSAFWGALVISVISFTLNILTGTGDARITMRREKRASRVPPPNGGGPVIDV